MSSWCNSWSDGLQNCNNLVRISVFLLRSLSDKYPWERYEPPYPPSYVLNCTTTVLLERLLWHWITHEVWYAIKNKENELFEIKLFICIKMDLALNNLQKLTCHKTQTNFRGFVLKVEMTLSYLKHRLCFIRVHEETNASCYVFQVMSLTFGLWMHFLSLDLLILCLNFWDDVWCAIFCVIFLTAFFIFVVVVCNTMFRLLYPPAFLRCPLFIWVWKCFKLGNHF